jgi:ATP-dependent helicase/nuclease subunit A
VPGDLLAGRVLVSGDLPADVVEVALVSEELSEAEGQAEGSPDWTPEQLEAIERRQGELLLDAGAGSGKTSVLVERFVRSVLEDGVAVDAILAITFTEKAAAELRDRVRMRLRKLGAVEQARATERAYMSTIHGFCARVLRAHALAAGLDPKFVVLDELEAGRLADLAFDDAIAVADSELIASYGALTLRGAILSIYGQLRSRGELQPVLPPLPAVVATEATEAGAALLQAAVALSAELGALPEQGSRVCEALARLGRVAQIVEQPDPWPGDLDCLRLPGGNGASLTTPACAAYCEALERFRAAAEYVWAARVHPHLDRLLRDFGTRYAQRKRDSSGLDFADLELLARDLLLRDPQLRTHYAERFERIMVDELQDTNPVQLELISAIARQNLFAVGDAQQSIYGFRHADVELFKGLGQQLEQRGLRATLETNFRSRPQILEVINATFGGRQLRPGRNEPSADVPLVELLTVEKVDAGWRAAEARMVAARIEELIAAGAQPREIVILTRAATDLRTYERALEERGIPTYLIGGRGYWSSPQVMDMVAYLRALANPRDERALYDLLASPLVGLTMDALVLVAAARREGNFDQPDGLAAGDASQLSGFGEWFERERRLAGRVAIEELIERALIATGYDLALLALPGGERRFANVRKLMRLAREYEERSGRDLRGFVNLVGMRAAGGRVDAKESEAPVEGEALDAVRLMTIHRAKGLEFKVVVVADLGREPFRRWELIRLGGEGELGLRLARPGTGKLVPALDYERLGERQRLAEEAEERRIFYVAMTRACERLILSGPLPSEGPIGWLAEELPSEGVARLTIEPPAEPDSGIPGLRQPDGPAEVQPPSRPVERPVLRTLSYSALAEYGRCGYRFYMERVLGIPPTSEAAVPAGDTDSGISATERGILVHELLEALDFRRPQRPEGTPADVGDLIEAFIGSSLFTRLAAARELHREEGFSFLLGDALITGVLDAVANEPSGRTLVVDYKSDRLEGVDPAVVAEREYRIQRLIYALAALRAGAETVEVVHLFLERPEEPVSATYGRGEIEALERELMALAAGALQGDFAVTDEPCVSVCNGCPAEGGLCSWPLEMTRRERPDRVTSEGSDPNPARRERPDRGRPAPEPPDPPAPQAQAHRAPPEAQGRLFQVE